MMRLGRHEFGMMSGKLPYGYSWGAHWSMSDGSASGYWLIDTISKRALKVLIEPIYDGRLFNKIRDDMEKAMLQYGQYDEREVQP